MSTTNHFVYCVLSTGSILIQCSMGSFCPALLIARYNSATGKMHYFAARGTDENDS